MQRQLKPASSRRPAGTVSKARALAAMYEPDEVAWLEESCRLIRAGRVEELDYPNLASYLDDMAIRERREVESRLRTLVAHLLKWHYQPQKRTRSWEKTVLDQRYELELMLESATLRRHAQDILAKSYSSAVRKAASETRLPPTTFPVECPYTLEQVLTEELA
jgi:Domain of unknown function DUF29